MQILEFDSEMTQPRLVPIIAADKDAEQYQGIVGSLAALSQVSQAIRPLRRLRRRRCNFWEVITDRDVITEEVTSVDLGLTPETMLHMQRATPQNRIFTFN